MIKYLKIDGQVTAMLVADEALLSLNALDDEKKPQWLNDDDSDVLNFNIEIAQNELVGSILSVKYALQLEIDKKAVSLGFSSGNALMLYAGFNNPFKTMALAFATWEATVWTEAETYKAQVLAGTSPMLTPEQTVAMMPTYPV